MVDSPRRALRAGGLASAGLRATRGARSALRGPRRVAEETGQARSFKDRKKLVDDEEKAATTNGVIRTARGRGGEGSLGGDAAVFARGRT